MVIGHRLVMSIGSSIRRDCLLVMSTEINNAPANKINVFSKPHYKPDRKILRVGLLVIMALLLIYSFIEPYWLQINTYKISSKDIPAAFNGTRIVFISDIHHGPFFSRERLRNLVNQINSLHPDIVLLGGDYEHRDKKYMEPCFSELARISAPLGKYGVLGNHDHWEEAGLCRESMRKAGITNLNEQGIWLKRQGERIKIAGIDDFWYHRNPDLPRITDDTNPQDFVLMVSHNPDVVEQIRDSRIDLVLSGHTHGGQVTLFGQWAPIIPSAYGQKYRYGFVKTEYTTVYVTSGIGTITPPVRFCARPEIAVFELHKK